VEPSEEIRRVIDRLTTAIAEGDSESVLGRLSDHPGTLIVGSDPADLCSRTWLDEWLRALAPASRR
jgi:hypothetical protein